VVACSIRTVLKDEFGHYTRLAQAPGKGTSLWLGEDHLVYVKGVGFGFASKEENRRFRYREIQAITTAGTSRLAKGILLGAALFGSLAILGLIFGLAAPDGLELGGAVAASIFGISSLLCGGLLMRHLILGPTCVCDLQTTLTTERLGFLNRLYRATEVARAIEERVRLSQLDLQESVKEGVGQLATTTASAALRAAYTVPSLVVPTSLAFAAYGLMLLAGLHLEIVALTGTILVATLGLSILLILALVVTVRRVTPESIRMTLWILLGLLFVLTGVSSVTYLILAATEPAYTDGVTGPLEAFTAMGSAGGGVIYGIILTLGLAIFIDGMICCLVAIRWKQRLPKERKRIGAVAPPSNHESTTIDGAN
jgi:hypothetical protein